MIRTSTLMSSCPPTRWNSRSCRTRKSFTCMAGEISPISSRKSVPPSACSNFPFFCVARSEEHTSELQSHSDLVCRLLLEKKKSGGGGHAERARADRRQIRRQDQDRHQPGRGRLLRPD